MPFPATGSPKAHIVFFPAMCNVPFVSRVVTGSVSRAQDPAVTKEPRENAEISPKVGGAAFIRDCNEECDDGSSAARGPAETDVTSTSAGLRSASTRARGPKSPARDQGLRPGRLFQARQADPGPRR